MRRTLTRAIGASIAALAMVAAGAGTAPAVTEVHGLIKGLDGGLYQPYKPSVVERTQKELKKNGIYQGKVDGVLDPATMKALGTFQKKHGILVSGVPSPYTRRALAG